MNPVFIDIKIDDLVRKNRYYMYLVSDFNVLTDLNVTLYYYTGNYSNVLTSLIVRH